MDQLQPTELENGQAAQDRPVTSKPVRQRRGRRWVWLLVLLALGAAGAYLWSKRPGPSAPRTEQATKGGGRAGRGSGAVPVIAVKARKGSIGLFFDGLGAVTPLATVLVRSRVDGQLMSVHYKEGDIVQKDDLLAEIDPRPFQVQLAQAKGQMVRDQALLANARVDLVRYQTLIKQNAVPEQQLTTQQALITQYEGAVQSDQASIDSANLNLTYSHITAPIGGRIGLRLVDPGNIVHASDTNGLLVITQLQPISVIFTIAEDQLPAVIRAVQAGAHLRVDAFSRDSQTKLASGLLTTIDNEIDQSTGTLKLRATFDNSRNELFPNQFVNARLLVQERGGVTLVPTAAVQRNSQMTYVWMVKPDQTVTVEKVDEGITEGYDTEVTSGLQPGDTVVMTGVDKLQEGSRVTVQFDNAPAGARGGAQGGAGHAGRKG